jgi:AcrR family transcriptional regulator
MSVPRQRPPSRRRNASPPVGGVRERLLKAADELFYQRGIRNVGIDELIATAGVAKASLYSHFESKDDLIAEYVRRRSDEWWTWFRESVESRAATPAARLMAMFDVLADWVAAPAFRGCALQNAAVELADATHAGHRAVVTGKRGVRAYLAELARQAGRRDANAVAEQLALLFEGAIVTALLEGSVTPALNARAAAAVLLRAR